ncbi:MAG TPA: arginine--tRNA ligase [Burkholderiales bacterium]|nr:arginine--tRNA ligase [Burkholderiales bacterium]
MSAHPDFRSHVASLLSDALALVAPETPSQVEVQRPKQADHGDFSCSVALQLARPMKKNPRDIARALVDALPPSRYVEKAEVAGAGFINIFLKASAKQLVPAMVLAAGTAYGRLGLGRGQKVQVEFVSANPTGPLHVGHGRGAAYGASLANVLEAAGYSVSREFYVNDAGRQMDILALSVWLRYLDLCGISLPFPGNAYQGDYVREMARLIHEQHGTRYARDGAEVLRGAGQVPDFAELQKAAPPAKDDAEATLDQLIGNAKRLLGEDYAYIHNFALTEQLGDCRNDLAEFGVTFDSWFSERSLYDSGKVEQAVAALASKDHVYLQDGAKWFRSSEFGDEKDRVVQRENGQYTYFASDIAYHQNKFERGFEQVIDVWGADHHGYIPRVKGALQALNLNPERLTVALVQFAVLYRDGKKVSMSTRAGEFVTLRELRNEVGNDAARFFYVLRRSDQHLDFDLDLAKSQSQENPVYYVQYAHARIASVLREWGGDSASLAAADASPLAGARELDLLQRLLEYPEVIEGAARELAPHLVVFYLRELAGAFHSYYNAERFLVPEEDVRNARLALSAAVGQVIRNGLALLGVRAPETM